MLMRPFGSFRSPWQEMRRLQRDMNRIFARMPRSFEGEVAPAYPAMNVWTKEDGAIVTAELPGINPEDIDISVVENTLTLKGNRQPDELQEGETYHRRERGYGAFARTFQLPFQVEVDEVEGVFEKGVLRISLPRAEAEKPKKIAVKAG